jgi:hypothetical protein
VQISRVLFVHFRYGSVVRVFHFYSFSSTFLSLFLTLPTGDGWVSLPIGSFRPFLVVCLRMTYLLDRPHFLSSIVHFLVHRFSTGTWFVSGTPVLTIFLLEVLLDVGLSLVLPHHARFSACIAVDAGCARW